MPRQEFKLEVLEAFTGGLNLRSDQFNLNDNESPDLLNVIVDPRGGIRQHRQAGHHCWGRDRRTSGHLQLLANFHPSRDNVWICRLQIIQFHFVSLCNVT